MIEFNEETHEYKENGQIIPSVTQVLPEQKFWCTPEQLEAARLDGIDNHSVIKMYLDTGETYGDPLIGAFIEWHEENKGLLGELVLYEEIQFSKKHRFAGRPDMIFTKAIVDLKRSPGSIKHNTLQNAGYSILAKENKIATAKTWINIWPDGDKIKSKNVYDPEAEDVFICLVQKWYLDKRIKNYMEV